MICYVCKDCGNDSAFTAETKWDCIKKKKIVTNVKCGECGSTNIKTFKIK